MKEEDVHSSRRVGVTHAIREKLYFFDERKWKRFSARRLELIDTLDLSSKKASEQEAQILKVAEALRIEFEYSLEYTEEFDRLVRAAIQSVRRNRKRSSKSKRKDRDDKIRHKDEGSHYGDSPFSHEEHSMSPVEERDGFVSEITKLNTDSPDEVNEYTKTKHISDYDTSRAAIDTMVQPRVNKLPSLPSFEKVSAVAQALSSLAQIQGVKTVILNYIERSKTCSEATFKKTTNLEFLGKGVIISSIGFVFEKSFGSTNEKSLDYLRQKLTLESYLAGFYRDLDPVSTKKIPLNDEAAVTTLCALLGGCVKDFGFEALMLPLCELFYLVVIKEYPLIAQNSVPFSSTSTNTDAEISKSNSFIQLNSLAAVASDIRLQERLLLPTRSRTVSPMARRESGAINTEKKAVSIRFLLSMLNFTFPMTNSATPKLDELLENARSAFHLSLYNDSQVLGLKSMKDGFIIKSDADLERIFKSEDSIELEVFTQKPQSVPIYEITSMVIPNKYILPPPVPATRLSLRPPELPLPPGNFKFLSNLEDPVPPPTVPKFQPLL